MMPPESFGIVGFGHFGRFLARSLVEHGTVLVADVDDATLAEGVDGARRATMDEIGGADVAIIAVPLSALELALEKLSGSLRPETVVMDVVSTKARATAILERVLGDHPNLLATHPLFGPPSMERIEPGDRLVVTLRKGEQADQLAEFLSSTDPGLGLAILERTPEEHDKAMAYMQALPFFIARALVAIDLPTEDVLSIPSFRKLASIAEIERHHSEGMFDTSQRGNPYAEEARRAFLDALSDLDKRLRGDGAVTT